MTMGHRLMCGVPMIAVGVIIFEAAFWPFSGYITLFLAIVFLIVGGFAFIFCE